MSLGGGGRANSTKKNEQHCNVTTATWKTNCILVFAISCATHIHNVSIVRQTSTNRMKHLVIWCNVMQTLIVDKFALLQIKLRSSDGNCCRERWRISMRKKRQPQPTQSRGNDKLYGLQHKTKRRNVFCCPLLVDSVLLFSDKIKLIFTFRHFCLSGSNQLNGRECAIVCCCCFLVYVVEIDCLEITSHYS